MRGISGADYLSALAKRPNKTRTAADLLSRSPPLKGVCFNLLSPIRAFAPQRSIFLLRREIDCRDPRDAHGDQISESGSARMIDDRVDNGRDSEGSRPIDGYPWILNSGGVIVGEKVENFLKKLS